MNYDPNLTMCGRCAKQTVILTFGMWEHRAIKETQVGGNCTGLTVIESAVGRIYDELYDSNPGYPQLILFNAEGEKLICEDDDNQREEWLKDMLIEARIIAIEPNGSVFEEPSSTSTP